MEAVEAESLALFGGVSRLAGVKAAFKIAGGFSEFAPFTKKYEQRVRLSTNSSRRNTITSHPDAMERYGPRLLHEVPVCNTINTT